MNRRTVIALLLILTACNGGLDRNSLTKKATDILQTNMDDFKSVAVMCDSFVSKFPNDRLDISFLYNAKSMVVFHRVENELSRGKEIFNNNNLGVSFERIKNVCAQNHILNIQVAASSAYINLNELNVTGSNIFIVYTKEADFCLSIKNDSGNWCNKLSEQFYLYCTEN